MTGAPDGQRGSLPVQQDIQTLKTMIAALQEQVSMLSNELRTLSSAIAPAAPPVKSVRDSPMTTLFPPVPTRKEADQ